jgi:zinc protease
VTAPTQRVPRPLPAPPRDYRFPTFTRETLPNGLRVVVAPVRKLPLITVSMLVDAGAAADPSGKEGLALLAARLRTEGTITHDGAELTARFERLGAAVESSADWDAAIVTMTVMTSRAEAALDLAAEVLLAPSFPEREVERLREERLAELLQLRAEPRGLADERFAELLYASTSRYARPEGGGVASVRTIGRGDILAFHAARNRPGSATIIVVGDIDAEHGVRMVERRLGGWEGSSAPPAIVDDGAAAKRDSVCLVHKPDAPQSELRIGHRGVPRRHPDYFAIVVMNAVLGGLFNSRINLNLRERHGYTYGAFSGFDWRRQSGPFAVATAVRTDVTDAAVREILAEIDRIRDGPIADDELSLATSYLDGVFPIRYETTASIAAALAGLVIHELPEDYFDTYRANIRSVTQERATEAARRYLDPSQMRVLAVGDADLVREPLANLGVGKVEVEEPRT